MTGSVSHPTLGAMYRTLLLIPLLCSPALADPATVVNATARGPGPEWRFDVTIAHPETWWEDYADGWRIETPDGAILGTRVLAHPHANEQPFTRSLGGVEVPEAIEVFMVRARTSVEGWADNTAGPFPLR